MELYILLFEKKMYQDFNRGFKYRIKFKFSIPFFISFSFFPSSIREELTSGKLIT